MTAVLERAIISLSAAQIGHQARGRLRPRMISKESVSMVIVVFLGMDSAFSVGPCMKRVQIASVGAKQSLQDI